MVRRTMACLGLFAFAVAIIGGLMAGNRMEFILEQALWAMVVFSGVGLGIGWAARFVVREHRSRQYFDIFGHAEGAAPPAKDSDVSSEPMVAEVAGSRTL